MKINYDPEADALYIKFSEANVEESDEIAAGMIVDYDNKGNPVGIEILDASKIFGGQREMRLELGLTEAIKR